MTDKHESLVSAVPSDSPAADSDNQPDWASTCACLGTGPEDFDTLTGTLDPQIGY